MFVKISNLKVKAFYVLSWTILCKIIFKDVQYFTVIVKEESEEMIYFIL